MPEHVVIPIDGVLTKHGLRTYLQLTGRLASRNSYLSAQLRVGTATATVRVWTLDEVTILDIIENVEVVTETMRGQDTHVRGELILRHARDADVIPPELVDHAKLLGKDIRALSTPDLRYAVTFIDEASEPAIRQERIDIVVSTLPALSESHCD